MFTNPTLDDPDTDTNFEGATLTIALDSYESGYLISIPTSTGTVTYDQNASTLSVSGTVVATTGGGVEQALVLTFNADANKSSIEAVMGAITFAIFGNDDPTAGNRTLTATFNDKANANTDIGALEGTLTGTLTIVPTNDTPTLTATPVSPTFTATGDAVSLFSDAAADTIEAGQQITGLTLTVANLADGADEILLVDGVAVELTQGTSGTTATNSIGYSVSVSDTTATVTLSKTDTSAVWQGYINDLQYQNTAANRDTTDPRIVTLTSITDDGGSANGANPTGSVSIASNVTLESFQIPPGFQSAVTSADGTQVILTYDKALDDANPPEINAFVVMVDGQERAITDVTINGSAVVLTLESPITLEETVTVAYTDPTADDDEKAIQDAAGNDAASLSATSVTNNATAGGGGKPNGVLFRAGDGVNGQEIWISDGTAEGTKLLVNLNTDPNPDYPTFGNSPENGSDAKAFFSFGNQILFGATSTGNTGGLWSTDGTEAGTTLIKDMGAGKAPYVMYSFGEKILVAVSGSTPAEHSLWITDGTPNNTTKLQDIQVEATVSGEKTFVLLGDKVYFSAFTATNGRELWETDGTVGGTKMVVDIMPGSQDHTPLSMVVLGDKIVYSGMSAAGRELWVSDGTAAGTQLLKDINTATTGLTSSNPAELTVIGNKVVFAAAATTVSGFTGNVELWITDGTTEGTELLKEINPTGSATPKFLTNFGPDKVLFMASNGVNQTQLWVTNGTTEGTELVKVINATAGTMGFIHDPVFTAFGEGMLFAANDGDGKALWITDGTESGTQKVKNIAPDWNKNSIMVVDDRAFVSASDGVNGTELWITDGTTDGTVLVKDIKTVEQWGQPGSSTPFGMTPVYIAPNDAPTVNSIERTTGTQEITNSDSLSYTVTFSEAVINVTTSAFELTTTGTATGTLGTPATSDGGLTWIVPITGVSGDGSLRLDLKASGTGIESTGPPPVAITGGFTGGQTFSIDNTPPTTTFSALGLSEDTGASSTDFITNVASQTLTATLSAELDDGDKVFGSLDAGATWTDITDKVSGTSLSWDGITLVGSSSIQIKAVDSAGNDGVITEQAFTLDTTAPDVPTITSAALTNTSTPVITGTAEVGSTVTAIIAGAT